jgi:hypothetical protein
VGVRERVNQRERASEREGGGGGGRERERERERNERERESNCVQVSKGSTGPLRDSSSSSSGMTRGHLTTPKLICDRICQAAFKHPSRNRRTASETKVEATLRPLLLSLLPPLFPGGTWWQY